MNRVMREVGVDPCVHRAESLADYHPEASMDDTVTLQDVMQRPATSPRADELVIHQPFEDPEAVLLAETDATSDEDEAAVETAFRTTRSALASWIAQVFDVKPHPPQEARPDAAAEAAAGASSGAAAATGTRRAVSA